MDQYYVTPDGQIAALPRRSFFDRLTSGLYDASVEYRRPGGGQEARLARTQPLTSALNQFGSQKRTFDQENSVLGRRQEFDAGQNELARAVQKAIADADRKQRADEFAKKHELDTRAEDRLTLDRNLKGWDTAKQFMMEQPKINAEIEAAQARAAASRAEAGWYGARETSALQEQQPATPELLALIAAVANNPQVTEAIKANPGLTNQPVSVFDMVSRYRPGNSGNLGLDPAIAERLFGGGGTPKAGPQINMAPGMTNRVGRVSASSLNP